MKWILMIFVLSVVGCSKENKPCSESKECGEGLKCVELTNTCRSRCAKDNDCGKGLICATKNNICIDPIIVKEKLAEEEKKEKLAEEEKKKRLAEERFARRTPAEKMAREKDREKVRIIDEKIRLIEEMVRKCVPKISLDVSDLMKKIEKLRNRYKEVKRALYTLYRPEVEVWGDRLISTMYMDMDMLVTRIEIKVMTKEKCKIDDSDADNWKLVIQE